MVAILSGLICVLVSHPASGPAVNMAFAVGYAHSKVGGVPKNREHFLIYWICGIGGSVAAASCWAFVHGRIGASSKLADAEPPKQRRQPRKTESAKRSVAAGSPVPRSPRARVTKSS
jgi:hypothetical protein